MVSSKPAGQPLSKLQRLEQYVQSTEDQVTYRPGSKEVHKEISTEACGKHLRNNVKVGDQGGLQDDGDVGGVEQLDGVSVVLPAIACRLDGQVDPKALKLVRQHAEE